LNMEHAQATGPHAPSRLPILPNGNPAPPAPNPDLDAILVELRRIADILRSHQQGADLEPLNIGRVKAARLFGVSPATFDRWDAAGLLGPVASKKGGRKLWDLAELREWSAASMPNRREWLARRPARSR
jgi:hypothetical protein